MDIGLNDSASVGGAITWILAEAVLPLPPSFEVTLPVVFCWFPAAIPVTFTEKLQDVPAGCKSRPRQADDICSLSRCDRPTAATANETVRRGYHQSCWQGVAKADLTKLGGSVVVLHCEAQTCQPFNGILAKPNCFEITGGTG